MFFAASTKPPARNEQLGGACHRYPPKTELIVGYPAFPRVLLDSWCGEWRSNGGGRIYGDSPQLGQTS